jgi:hypothetical protein
MIMLVLIVSLLENDTSKSSISIPDKHNVSSL